MSPRSLISLVLVFGLVAGAVWVSQLNRDSVTLRLPGLAPMSAPLWVVLFMTLLLGVFLALLYSLMLSSREAMGRWRQARRERDTAATAAAMRAGISALVREDYGTALARLDAATAAESGNAEAWLLAGDAARSLGDVAGAAERHQRAQALLPDDARVIEALARDAEAAGDTTRALRLWRQVIAEGRATPRALGRARDLCVAEADWDGAIELQEQLVVEADGDRARRMLRGLRSGRGRQLLAEGRTDEAAAVATRLVQEAPEFEPGQMLLGDAHVAAGDPGQAMRDWEAAVEATRSVELLRRLANLYLDNEQPEESIRVLREATATLPGARAIAARILLARLYYRLELIDEASELLDELAGQVDESPVVNFYLAKARHRREDTAAAYTLLKETIRAGGYLDPRFRCQECNEVHGAYADRCDACDCWGSLRMDLSSDARQVEEAVAPQV